jgi:hypothetical protein
MNKYKCMSMNLMKVCEKYHRLCKIEYICYVNMYMMEVCEKYCRSCEHVYDKYI